MRAPWTVPCQPVVLAEVNDLVETVLVRLDVFDLPGAPTRSAMPCIGFAREALNQLLLKYGECAFREHCFRFVTGVASY